MHQNPDQNRSNHKYKVKGSAYPEIKEYDFPKGSKLVHEVMSPYQLIRVFQGKDGCWMSLNGDMQFHEGECDVSHYFMCDVPLNYFKNGRPTFRGGPPSVLVIGGGDGLPGKRLQKHGLKFTQVELDPDLISVTKTHPVMRKVCDDSFNSKYIELICGDGLDYVINSKQKWDLIIDDCDVGSTLQPGTDFYNHYENYKKALFKKTSPYGIVSLTEEILVLPNDKLNTVKNKFLDLFRAFHKGSLPPPRKAWANIMEDNVSGWQEYAPYGKHFAYELPVIGPEHYFYLSKKPL